MNKKPLIRATQYAKLLVPENTKSLFFVEKSLKKMGRTIDWYAKRGTKIHKKLEKEIKAGSNKSILGQAIVDLIETNGFHKSLNNDVITEKTIKSSKILNDYYLKGTFDLVYKDSLYDYKSISRARLLDKDNLKRIAIQQILYLLLIKKETDIKVSNSYIIWIDIDKDSRYNRLVLYQIEDFEGNNLVDFTESFDLFDELWEKRIKNNKFILKNKGEHIF